MIIEQHLNKKLLAYLVGNKVSHSSDHATDLAACAPWNSIPDPYKKAGCHPEAVEQLWDVIGSAMPEDCRRLIHGTPALVHPNTAVIFGIGMGTEYGLWLPGALAEIALKCGYEYKFKYFNCEIQLRFGSNWYLGRWRKDETLWCKRLYDDLESHVIMPDKHDKDV